MNKEDIQKLDNLGYIADSKKLRNNLILQLENHEKSLKDIQSELAYVKKTAKNKGLYTTDQLVKAQFSLEQAIKMANEQQIKYQYDKLLKKLPQKKIEKRTKI